MKTGDFVLIDYVGRVKESGEIFDVTIEEVAKKEKLQIPHPDFRPVSVVIGADFVIKGLDEALQQMSVGEKRTVPIDFERAFGPRSPKLITAIPSSAFKDQRMDPTPGTYVMINNMRGRIVSSDGGRVKVDFNHPLAGKNLEYEVEVKTEITDVSDKVRAVVSHMIGHGMDSVTVKLAGKEADVGLNLDHDHHMGGEVKKRIAELVVKWVKEVEKVRFVEEFDGKAEPKKEE